MAQSDLIPFNQLTEEEQKKLARAGGVASGIARRHAKDLKTAALEAMKEVKGDGAAARSAAEAIIQAQIREAVKGDTSAARFLADITGAITQKVELGTLQPVQLINDGLND